ncbi:MAG TPA: hypothetical protein VIJ65_01445 [Acidobacteriaceae bacterium]
MKTNCTVLVLLCAALVSPSYNSACADFTYTETTQVSGGSLVSMMKMAGAFSKSAREFGQPVESTVIVKGNRMTRIDPDYTEIIDLDKDTITRIDNTKHRYTIVTFEQMKQQMDEAMARAKAQQAKQPAAQQAQLPPGTEVKFTVKVRNTDASKNVAGLNAKEAIMVMAMDATQTSGQAPAQTATLGFTSDIWLVPEIPGYKEVRDFYMRMAEKMGSIFGAGSGTGDMTAMMGQLPPGAMQGMADMGKEMSKIKGIPVLTVMRMGTTVNGAPLPAASEAPLPASNTPPPPSAGDMAKQGATSAITNSLHLGGFGLGKKKAANPPPPAADPDATAGPVVMMETTTQLSSFSSGRVDPSRFEVPASYKQIDEKDLH